MQSIFKRYEKKYLVTEKQCNAFKGILAQYMIPDQYGEYLVQNLYYDTENWDVIRASIEKPIYKEKMRLRCYGIANDDSTFYLELKKKYEGVVYKRRIAIPSESLTGGSVRNIVSTTPSQISREFDFYMQSNEVSEKIYIAYQRLAFAGLDDTGLRVTFDSDIRFRLDDLCFSNSNAGEATIPEGKMVMEIKTLGGMPLWMASALSENEIFPISFSKFGICYVDHIYKQLFEEKKVKVCA